MESPCSSFCTSQSGQCQLSNCLIPIFLTIQCDDTFVVFTCTIYTRKKKPQEIKCNIQAISDLLIASSPTWLSSALTETWQNMRKDFCNMRSDSVQRISELKMANSNLIFLFFFILSLSYLCSHLLFYWGCHNCSQDFGMQRADSPFSLTEVGTVATVMARTSKARWYFWPSAFTHRNYSYFSLILLVEYCLPLKDQEFKSCYTSLRCLLQTGESCSFLDRVSVEELGSWFSSPKSLSSL